MVQKKTNYHLEHDIIYYPASLPVKAVTLVVHGLNVKPGAMLPLINWLNEEGSDVCLVRLAGHHENSIPLHEVSFVDWESSVRRGYDYAKNIATLNRVPLIFLGYSLGALLGQVLISSDERIVFDKQVLLAPATALRKRVNLVRFLFLLGDRRTLPGFTPADYRANKRLPIKVYKILFKMNSDLLKTACQKLNIPTLVFIDPKDELISYTKLSWFCRRYGLTRHELVPLDSDPLGQERQYHHLILNEKVMGKKNWEMMTRKMQSFIFKR